jgi:ankyrin repeat protein
MIILYILMIILMIHPIVDTQGGRSALHWAVIKGYCDCVQLLIHGGADVNIKNNVNTLYVHIVHHRDHTHDTTYY